jgi:hypothetical protein
MDHIEHTQLSSIAHSAGVTRTERPAAKEEELARAFLAAFKKADELAKEVNEADKKDREDDEKRRRNFTKADYEKPDEVEEILEEIDKRLERMLEIAREYDA